jgi:hypothetical protein
VASSRRRSTPPKGRVSGYFGLRRNQSELDFVDVDVWGDTPLFISPGALRQSESEWAHQCIYVLQNYMETVLEAVREGDEGRALSLLSYLREPNETHLGLSKGKAKGHAIGDEYAQTLLKALAESSAGRSGLIQDLEDTVLLVDGIGSDLISDITTNIIRGPLIEYTEEICESFDIPMVSRTDQPVWDTESRSWEFPRVELPLANGPLILIPKFLVRRRVDSPGLFRDYLFDFIAERELQNPNSEFVRVLKNGTRAVDRTALRNQYRGKGAIEKAIAADPGLHSKYKQAKLNGPKSSSNSLALLTATNGLLPDLDKLFEGLKAIPPGNEHFNQYEVAIDRLIGALFSSVLRFPSRQQKENNGRKRIDIVWTNDAKAGFFAWLKGVCSAHYVVCECKNYGEEIANPDFDQLAMRFGPSQGMFGLLVCRKINDKEIAFQRARDILHQDKKYIIPIDDDDLKDLVEAAKEGADRVFEVLQGWFKRLAF